MQAKVCAGAAIALLTGIAVAKGAPVARADCEAFGQVYRDGESFTLSTGEYGERRAYICTHGSWNEYDANLWQLRRVAR